MALLGADEGGRVVLAAVELVEHLVGRVTTPRAVAADLPVAAQFLGRGQEDTDVEDVSQGLRVVAEQALDDREALRLHVDRRTESAVLVAVDRLQDAPAGADGREVLLHDVHVVAVGVQRRDLPLGPLLTVVAVIVVGGDMGYALLAEQPYEPAGDGRLAGRRIADYSEENGTGHLSLPYHVSWARSGSVSSGSVSRSGSSPKTELRRMS